MKRLTFVFSAFMLIFILLPRLSIGATDCVVQSEIPEAECNALIALYDNTSGVSWTENTDWKVTNTPCSWKGVTCSGGHLTEIDLNTNQMTGTIPIELGNLVNLTYLGLYFNQLTGTIPAELGNLNNLTKLHLHGNQLTGAIPIELGNLLNLTELWVSDNQLSAGIPSELCQLTLLTQINLNHNQLTGAIPSCLGNLNSLTQINFNTNQLSGTIPSEVGHLVNLTLLNLDTNQLSGMIPVELSYLVNLNYLGIYSNPSLCRGNNINYAPWEAEVSTYPICPTTADLSITQSVSDTSVNSGATFSYTLSVTNTGPDAANSVQVTDNLPQELTFVSVTGSDWTCKENSGVVTCDFLNNSLANGVTTDIIINVTAPVITTEITVNNTATVSTSTTDPDNTNNSEAKSTNIVLPPLENKPPQLSTINDQTVTVGNTLNLTVSATDENAGDQLTYSLVTAPSGAIIDPTSGELTWTPNSTGDSTTITVKVTDDATSPLSDEKSFDITVQDGNKAPQLSVINNQTVTVGNALNLTISATDENAGDQLTYSLVTAPSGAIIEPTSGVLTWTPNSTGDSTMITVKVIDDATLPLSDEKSFDITVQVVSLRSWGIQGAGEGEFEMPSGIAIDSQGNIYMTDTDNHRIQKFDSNGNFLLQWGSQGIENGQFNSPQGIAIDFNDNIYIADTLNHRIQKFDKNGNFLSAWGSEGTADGEFSEPRGMTVDVMDAIYVADTNNNRVQKFDSSGFHINTWGTLGSADGEFDQPIGIATDSQMSVYVIDSANNRVQKFDDNGNFQTTWGTPGAGDGEFNQPVGIAIDSQDRVYITDANHRIQTFDSTGVFSGTFGSSGSANGEFNQPIGIAINGGMIYVVDTGNHRIQAFSDTPSANLAISQTASIEFPAVGDSLSYTLTVENLGPNPANSVKIEDTLPAQVSYTSATGTDWSCVESAGTVICDYQNTLDAGITAEPVIITVSVNANGTLNNIVSVGSTVNDHNGTNDSNTLEIPDKPPEDEADLAISQSVSSESPKVGDSLIYTIAVNNNGPDTATDIQIKDTLPTQVSYTGATGTDWICVESAGTVTCDYQNTLDAGITAGSITITVSINTDGTLSNTVNVDSAINDQVSSNNSHTIIKKVNKVNNAPTLESIGNQTVSVNDTLSFKAEANDLDGDNLSFSLGNAPTGASITAEGEFTWIPGNPGTFDNIQVIVTDDGIPPLNTEEIISITVSEGPSFSLQTDISPEGGSIERDPEGTSYPQDTPITLTAIPSSACYEFVNWTGDCQGTSGPTCSLIMDADKSATAHFQAKTFTLNVQAEHGRVSLDPAKMIYACQETVTLTALPVPGSPCYEFANWTGDCQGNEPVCSIQMDADKAMNAIFQQKSLTLNIQADHGHVVLNPDKAEYACQEVVTLKPVADEGYQFIQWGLDLSGEQRELSLAVQSNMDIQANFGKIPDLKIEPTQMFHAKVGQTLSFTASGGLNQFFWTATGGEIYPAGATATFTVPEAGVFYIWVSDGEQFAWALVDATDTLVLLQIVPDTLNLWKGETQAILVRGYYPDGKWVNLTQRADFQIEEPDIAQILNKGEIEGISEGETILSVHYQNLEPVNVPIQIQDKPPLLKVEPELLILYEGTTQPVTVYSISPTGEKLPFPEAQMSILDPSIASLEDQTLTGLNKGLTWLNVSAGENTLPIRVIVQSRPPLDITPAFAVMEQNEPIQFSVTGGQIPYEMTADQGNEPEQDDESTFVYQSEQLGTTILTATDSSVEQQVQQAEVKIVPPLTVTPTQAVVSYGGGQDITLRANGGESPYVWTVTRGDLNKTPSDTVIYTAPSRAGLHTVTVIDALGNSQEALILVGNALSLSQKQLFLTLSEEIKLKVLGGVPPYTLDVSAGEGHLDMIADAINVINYTAPNVSGTYSLRIHDTQNNQVTADVNVRRGLIITPQSGHVDKEKSLNFQATGGFGKKRWRTTQGILDKSEGESVIWTAPARLGSAFVHVSDAGGATATATIEISSEGLTITPSMRQIHPDKSAVFTVTGGGSPYQWRVEAGDYSPLADDSMTYTAPGVKNTYWINVQDVTGKEAQAQVNVYSAHLLASPETLYLYSGETSKITISGGTRSYTLGAALGQLTPNKITLLEEEIYSNSEYTAPKAYQGYDTITITDTAGNKTNIGVEISCDMLSFYAGLDGKIDDQEMQQALDDFFAGKTCLSTEDLYWIGDNFAHFFKEAEIAQWVNHYDANTDGRIDENEMNQILADFFAGTGLESEILYSLIEQFFLDNH